MATGTTSNGDDRLMRYFDGELPAEEMEVVRAELDGDADLRARLDGLAHMRGLMADAMQDVGADLDADAMFSAIEARLDEDAPDDDPMLPAPVADPEPEERPQLRVVPGGKQDDVAAEVVHPEAPSRTGVWLGVAGALAAAAALFLILRPPSGGGDDPHPAVAAPQGSEIEDVDFGDSTGSIFTVEDPEDDTGYAVIWISDAEIEDASAPDDGASEDPSLDPEPIDPEADGPGALDEADDADLQPPPPEPESPE